MEPKITLATALRGKSPFILASTSDPVRPKRPAAFCDGVDSERSQVAGRSADATNVELLCGVDWQPLLGSGAFARLEVCRWLLPVVPQRICSPSLGPFHYYRSFAQCVRGFRGQEGRKQWSSINIQAIIPANESTPLRGGAVGVLSRGYAVCPVGKPRDGRRTSGKDILFPF